MNQKPVKWNPQSDEPPLDLEPYDQAKCRHVWHTIRSGKSGTLSRCCVCGKEALETE